MLGEFSLDRMIGMQMHAVKLSHALPFLLIPAAARRNSAYPLLFQRAKAQVSSPSRMELVLPWYTTWRILYRYTWHLLAVQPLAPPKSPLGAT